MSSSKPRTPPGSPPQPPRRHSRGSSLNSTAGNQHAPTTPSRLSQSHHPGPSPSASREVLRSDASPRTPATIITAGALTDSPPSQPLDVEFHSSGIQPVPEEPLLASTDPANVDGLIDDPEPDAETRLLEGYHQAAGGRPNYHHGWISPRPATYGSIAETMSIRSEENSIYNFGGRYRGEVAEPESLTQGLLGNTVSDGVFNASGDADNGAGNGKGRLSTTKWLAKRHGVKTSRRMYLAYYLPFTNWVGQYQWEWLKGDLVAAITMASFYIPMALSYAENLGHVPPINGLYSFVFNPIIYAILGTCPLMVVGPEAAGSLLVGGVIRSSVDKGESGDDNGMINARIAGVVTGMAGAIIFMAGLTRLGFLDNVLSRPFLRGFISAIGFVIFIDQLIPETGLVHLSKISHSVSHGSTVDKIMFLFQNIGKAHALTCWVSFGSFAIIMVLREIKKRLQPRYPNVAYFPDRFLVVALSAVFANTFSWDKKGVEILKNVQSTTGSPFPFHWPFVPSHMKHVREAMSTSFLIALLGFFESSVAAKSITGGREGRPGESVQGMSLSANRELVALGVANLVGSCFMALPAFGGYGRSKVNAATGGKTPMSSIFLSLITLICILFLLPYFYYLPKGVLSAMVSVVAYSLIEEAPHDIKFFLKIRGFSELSLMAIIFLSTIFYSLPLGIALGMGLSILQVIKHATKPRIQILGKNPGTNQFENAEESPENLEFIEGCLIVKVPEPLTFANTGDLKNRLRRLEMYGTQAAHPALPRVRSADHNKNVIFDVHGVTSIDGSGAQVFLEIVQNYVDRGVRVFFCRVPRDSSRVYRRFNRSGIVDIVGRERFVRRMEDALAAAEEDQGET